MKRVSPSPRKPTSTGRFMPGADRLSGAMDRMVQWIDYRIPIFSFLKKDLEKYPTPKNLNYLWNFGSLAGITLVVMILSGIFLAMHYKPSADQAFESVERIMRDVNFGWLIRYMHMNGASIFFIVVYIHMFRGLYYGSFKSPRELLWIVGVVIYLLMMATAFLGYVLPWGQMSYWGATVITSLFSAIPLVGESIVTWLWGGFSVGDPTLNRFFVLHFLFPFLIVGVVGIHLIALHQHKSNNPTGVDLSPRDMIPFHPYYTIKDLFGIGVYVMVFAFFVFFMPNFFGEPINYVPANPLVTPPHIVPEWYFLPFYAILRSVPSKLGGVVLMFGAVFVLFILPWLDTHPIRSATFRPWYKWAFWFFVVNCGVLGWIGAMPPEGIYVVIGQTATVGYFAFFLVALPLLSKIEPPRPLPDVFSGELGRGHASSDKKSRLKVSGRRGKSSSSSSHMTFLVIFLVTFLTVAPWVPIGISSMGYASEDAPRPPAVAWSFSGPFGTFDRAQLQRGFQVYKEVCSTCHALEGVHYRDLGALGYTEAEIKAFAAQAMVKDGPNDEGEMFERPGIPSDAFFKPYPNAAAARAANNGAYPINLSLITKANPYGADYVRGMLVGYQDPPLGFNVPEGMYYNRYFAGHLLAMPPPLTHGQVIYADGTQPTIDQMAKDVAAFLAWAAEPELETRKQMGFQVLIYAFVLTLLLYAAMRRIWGRLDLTE